MEYTILPALALQKPNILKQQEEMASMLFALLGQHKKWMLIHQVLERCCSTLSQSCPELPAPIRSPLRTLLFPPNLNSVKVWIA